MDISNSNKLKLLLEMSLKPLITATHQLFEHKDFQAIYPWYLINLHWQVRASIPLMKEAISSAKFKHSSSTIYDELIKYFENHCLEEKNHDIWLLEDLEAIGIFYKDFENIVPTVAVANMVGTQYYWIKHYDPVALLGYVLVIEGNSILPSYLEKIKITSGITPKAFRTIDYHSKIDKSHADDLYAFLAKLNLEHQQFLLITRSALATIKHATILLKTIIDDVPMEFNQKITKLS